LRTAKRAYDKDLADIFGLSAADSFASCSLPHSMSAVTQIVCNTDHNGLTKPLRRDDAFLVTVQLRDCPEHDLWMDGQPMPTGPLQAGRVSVYDLRADPRVNSISPFRNIHFYFPRTVLVAAAEGDEIAALDLGSHNPGLGVHDPALHGLARSLLPAFEQPGAVTPLFVSHVTTAAAAYLVGRFGRAATLPGTGLLAAWQMRRLKALLHDHSGGDLSIEALARECGLPPAVFLRAFRKTTGSTPNNWLRQIRASRN
jgi:hypothetical protein